MADIDIEAAGEQPHLDSDPDPPASLVLCTHAITGSEYPAYQPIYVCETCYRRPVDFDSGESSSTSSSSTPQHHDSTNNSDVNNINEMESNADGDDDDQTSSTDNNDESPQLLLPSCICQSCAEVCHADHEVSYVGIGPCTCDCLYLQFDATTDSSNLKQNRGENGCDDNQDDADGKDGGSCGCKLADHSSNEAIKLGFNTCRPLNAPLRLKVPPPPSRTNIVVEAESTGDDDANVVNSLLSSTGMDYTTCIECNSTLGGYLYESYTIIPDNCSPDNVNEGETINVDSACAKKKLHSFCENLISQALALDKCSNDTFWIPSSIDANCTTFNANDAVDKEDNSNEVEGGYCDLELFAREVYQHHVKFYMSHLTTSNNINTGGGAEWWVQVKPAGSPHAPVNLHYDKDETLAEEFGLGSFPTLSTVTYLTDAQDNVPTIVFPRTYNDEIDVPIESMLGKHLIFDGRLFHGAPAHRSLLRQRWCNRSEEDENMSTSSLRVTLLVNIWLSGKPACVNVLPECIRSKVKCVATKSSMMNGRRIPLGFAKRNVSNISVRAKASTKLNNDNAADEEMIILPFVSNGNTYAGVDNDADNGDNVEAQVNDDSEVAFTEVETSGGDSDTYKGSGANSKEPDDENDEDVSQDEDDEELFLVLSPFVIDDYTEDEADTFVLSFEDGNGAQIISGDALEEISSRRHCPWKKFAASNLMANGGVGENRISDATVFLSYLRDNVPSFVSSVIEELTVLYEMDVTTHHADHVCYRTESIEQYSRLVNALSAATNDFSLLTESLISGRPIATFKMTTPITIKTADGTRILDVIEIPSPKDGSPYQPGLEHVEFVLGDGAHNSPVNSEAHQIALTDWMSRYPSITWNVKALDKACNPDISTSFGIAKYGTVTVKFHLIPLEDVIKFETISDNDVPSTSIADTAPLE
ncbi:hypothetical protein ACHAWU_001315 [Discostella pseudostelligera]|uniref:Uncharacterized protein n=1 Tax=Discostella pseudostelligera TaxID=259834 RepID=A0ABD3MCV5_9STRA